MSAGRSHMASTYLVRADRRAPMPKATIVDDAGIEAFAVDVFKQLLRCDTTNYGGGNGSERAAVDVLQRVFTAEGIPFEVVGRTPDRPNIIARLTGNGSSGRRPVLLSAHLDVVPAVKWKEEQWQHDPFAAFEDDDGVIYGRGAIDMKHHAATSVAILVALKRSGISLHRDLIFAGVADEEDGSHYGVEFLVRQHPDLIEAEVMFTEAGGFPFYFNGALLYPVQIAEKGHVNVTITSRGTGGHSSVPHKDNAIGMLGRAASALAERRLPFHLTPQAQPTFDVLSSSGGYATSLALQALLMSTSHEFVLDRVLPSEASRMLEPFLHNLAVPTTVSGGVKSNQVPASAELKVDCRVLPGFTVDDVIDEIKGVVGNGYFDRDEAPSLHIEANECGQPALCQDPSDPRIKAVLDAIQNVINGRGPAGPIIPMMCPGGTDAKHYARHPSGMLCIGFAPLHFDESWAFSKLFHGVNERLSRQGLIWGLHVLYDLVDVLCVDSNPPL
ncbi:unnamed protein product (mitochondrion) [Plasmodiophora brassicae]|uniref:Peptidase M20 dimerisation domain-containing protein n=2 Tax=Plasmodiophora brassicae TaxID=37360 RepID=A0A3P3YCJ8_PLABS|nr:unnamed protein product [Plasmodiophora brassicae]